MSDPLIYADAHSDSPMEYLQAGQPPRPRRKARPWVPMVAGIVTFVVVLFGVGVVTVDWVDRSLEMRQLVSQIEVSEQAMASTQVDVAHALEDYQANPQPTAADQAAFETVLKAAAAKGLVGITAGGKKVEAVRILPWHTGIKDAQKAYLAHNHAWQDYLTKASKDAAEFGKNQEAVNSTFAAAEKPMRSAVPTPDMFSLAKRVNVIYAADPAAPDGSGQQA